VAKLDPDYDRNVFINCPFDREYLHLRLDIDDLTFVDLSFAMGFWLERRA